MREARRNSAFCGVESRFPLYHFAPRRRNIFANDVIFVDNFLICRRRNDEVENGLQAGFPLGEFVRANREKANVIGW